MYKIKTIIYSKYVESNCRKFRLFNRKINSDGFTELYEFFESYEDAKNHLLKLTNDWYNQGVITEKEHFENLSCIEDGFLNFDNAICFLREA